MHMLFNKMLISCYQKDMSQMLTTVDLFKIFYKTQQ
jgi:hypothetical protein